MITHVIGLRYPKHCKANHSNMPNIGGPDAGPPPDFSKLTPRERASMERAQWFRTEASGYFSLQTTRPMTLAYGLQDSPVATLAWIYEKLLDWTDDYPWTDDEVLTWISIYVFSRAGPGASVFIYYEVSCSPCWSQRPMFTISRDHLLPRPTLTLSSGCT